MPRSSGPPPKRTSDRRRRNAGADVDRAALDTGGAKLGPPCPREITGLGRRWYESLRTSGQAAFYTDSDWATAMIVARAIARFDERPSAHLLTAILSGCASLAATEGERRRLRLELERDHRGGDADEEAAVASLAEYRRMIGG
ncbi:hypothetical protein SMC26_40370 [Actinomadura fulvescens]|uniref:Terminase small subunit n=1 Tax=Actinomadura fulvescens TaxID=46160 RepID=A0ABP6CFV4_9ACTN